MADVIPIAHVSKLQTPQRSTALAQRKEIGVGLTGVKTVRERIDYRDIGILSELLELPLLEDARNDSMHPARKVSRHIGNGLALTEPRNRLVQKNGRAAQAAHTYFKGYPRAQRRLFQNHSQEASRQSARVLIRAGFDVGGKLK